MVARAVIVAINHEARGVRGSVGIRRHDGSTQCRGNGLERLQPIRAGRHRHAGVFAVLDDGLAPILANNRTETGSEVSHDLESPSRLREQRQQMRRHGFGERPGVALWSYT